MLGHTYRWQVYNGTGVSVTCTVKTRLWKFDSSGALVYASESTPISAVSIGTVSYDQSSTIDNSTALNMGAVLTITFAPGSSATGTVALYLQESTDGGTTWPDNGKGLFVDSAYFAASSTAQKFNSVVE